MIKEVRAKSILTKSRLPGSDYVINPYTGCTHGCKYCYATFMKKFTGHTEPWGQFVDVKVNAPDLLKNVEKCRGKQVCLSSVTDPYQPVEAKYELMRGVLKKLIPVQPRLCVLTKSSLVLRDLDLLKKFKHCVVGISLSITNEVVREQLEPGASSIAERVRALKELHETGIRTVVFIAPIHERSDWRGVISQTKDFVDYYMFDKLNYKKTSIDPNVLRKEIKDYCKKNKVNCEIIF